MTTPFRSALMAMGASLSLLLSAPLAAQSVGRLEGKFDVLACPRCGGRLRLIALIEERAEIERMLRHLGVPTAIPAPRPARAPPLSPGAPDPASWDDDPTVLASCS